MIATILNKTFRLNGYDDAGEPSKDGLWEVDVVVDGKDGSRRAVETIPGSADDDEAALLAEVNRRWGIK